MSEDRNVLGGELELCGTDPMTGWTREGCCTTGAEDVGSHTVCAVVTEAFLTQQKSVGNDLTRPQPGFPGLVPGDRWCVCASRWRQAYESGAPTPVVLAATHERALEVVPDQWLREHAVDIPDSPEGL